MIDLNPLGTHFAFRFNTLHKPFDDPRIREAALYALSQKDLLAAGVGNPKYEKVCKDLFGCGTPLSTTEGLGGQAERRLRPSRRSSSRRRATTARRSCCCIATDLAAGVIAPVAKALLERGGFKVDMHVDGLADRPGAPLAQGGAVGRRLVGVRHHARHAPTSSIRSCRSSPARPARRRRSAGRATRRSRSCATTSRAPPIRPSARRFAEALQVRLVGVPDLRAARPVQHAGGDARPTCRGNLEAPATVFWNVKKGALSARKKFGAAETTAGAFRAYIPPSPTGGPHGRHQHAEERTHRHRLLGSQARRGRRARRHHPASSCRRPRPSPACSPSRSTSRSPSRPSSSSTRSSRTRRRSPSTASRAHFKTLILEQAVPKLAKRERTQHRFV